MLAVFRWELAFCRAVRVPRLSSQPRRRPPDAHARQPQSGGVLRRGGDVGGAPACHSAGQRAPQPARDALLRADRVSARVSVPVRADVSAATFRVAVRAEHAHARQRRASDERGARAGGRAKRARHATVHVRARTVSAPAGDGTRPRPGLARHGLEGVGGRGGPSPRGSRLQGGWGGGWGNGGWGEESGGISGN